MTYAVDLAVDLANASDWTAPLLHRKFRKFQVIPRSIENEGRQYIFSPSFTLPWQETKSNENYTNPKWKEAKVMLALYLLYKILNG